MDLIGNVYTAVETWCRAEYSRMGYWMTAVLAYILGPPTSSNVSPSKKNKTTSGEPTVKVVRKMTVPKNVPSIIEIKRILPRHCFTSSLPTSMYYVAKDLILVLALYASILLAEQYLPLVVYVLYLPVYWMLLGTVFWAIFVLGHDCGHGSFSAFPLLNDVVGTFLHTIISVPFYPWKLSHKHHHKNTGNMDQDEIFYPVREKDDNMKGGFITGFGLGFGWFIYLVIGFSPRKLCHFNPMEHIFIGHVVGCVASLASLLAWFYALSLYYQSYGVYALTAHYLVPTFVFGSWLVIVTFLHHMDTGVPWYADGQWSNVLGQLSTVDRDYGWAHHLTHHIGTHQIHHLFTKVPHYHL